MDLQAVALFTTTLVAIVNPIASSVLFAAMAGRFLLHILGIPVPMLQGIEGARGRPARIPGTVGAGTITTVVIQATTFTSARDVALITAICVRTGC